MDPGAVPGTSTKKYLQYGGDIAFDIVIRILGRFTATTGEQVELAMAA